MGRSTERQRITPFLWFDGPAEAAANHYVSIFPESAITSIARYGDAGPGSAGSVMTVSFTLDGQSFTALNGGPMFRFTPAISLVVNCETQAEVDHYWDRLGEGGAFQPCGWLTDRFGLSWQVLPSMLTRLLETADPPTAARIMASVHTMQKLIVGDIESAAGT